MKKLVIIVLFTLVLSSLAVCAQDLDIEKESNMSFLDDDVPVWEVGNSWTYNIDTFLVQLNESGQFIKFDFTIDGFTIEVESETTTSYELSISGNIAGTFEYDDGEGTIIKGKLYFTRLSGSFQIRKSDLAVEQVQIVVKSIAVLNEHPLPIPIPIPIPLTITVNILQTTPRPLIDFPLFDGKIGQITEAQMTMNIKVESIVLKILHIFIPDIPEEILLDQAMNLPMLIYSATVEEVTVGAGTFSAYNIAFFEGLFGSVYYAPTAGNIIKAEAELEVPDQLLINFNGELTDTNYL